MNFGHWLQGRCLFGPFQGFGMVPRVDRALRAEAHVHQLRCAGAGRRQLAARPTLVFIDTVAIGLTIFEVSEDVEVRFDGYPVVKAAAMVTVAGESLAYHLKDLQSRFGDYGRAARASLSMGALYTAADYVQAQRVRASRRSWAAVGGRARPAPTTWSPPPTPTTPRARSRR